MLTLFFITQVVGERGGSALEEALLAGGDGGDGGDGGASGGGSGGD